MSKATYGYLLALETTESPPDVKFLEIAIQELLSDHGFDVTINIEGMGNIDCYEGEDD